MLTTKDYEDMQTKASFGWGFFFTLLFLLGCYALDAMVNESQCQSYHNVSDCSWVLVKAADADWWNNAPIPVGDLPDGVLSRAARREVAKDAAAAIRAARAEAAYNIAVKP